MSKPQDIKDSADLAKASGTNVAKAEPQNTPAKASTSPVEPQERKEAPKTGGKAAKAAIPASALDVVVEALRVFEATGARPTITREATSMDDTTSIVRPDADGPGLVLTVIEGERAYTIADNQNRVARRETSQAEARVAAVEKDNETSRLDLKAVEEDHKKGLRTDAELAAAKRSYEDLVAHRLAPVEADRKFIAEKEKKANAPKPTETRVVIEKGWTAADFLKAVTIKD